MKMFLNGLLLQLMDESVLNSPQMTARLIGNRPNTYTFTKVKERHPAPTHTFTIYTHSPKYRGIDQSKGTLNYTFPKVKNPPLTHSPRSTTLTHSVRRRT
jgi:hypothetical protein